MIVRVKSFSKFYLVCSDITERYDIGQPSSFTSIFKPFVIKSYLEGLWFELSHIFIFESSQLNKLSTEWQDSGL